MNASKGCRALIRACRLDGPAGQKSSFPMTRLHCCSIRLPMLLVKNRALSFRLDRNRS